MTKFAGVEVTHGQIVRTMKILSVYRRFLKSDYEKCHNMEFRHGEPLTKPEARTRLWFLVNTAINRKAGIPDEGRRKRSTDYWIQLRHDVTLIRNRINHRIRFYSLETPEMRRRYGHLVSTREDY